MLVLNAYSSFCRNGPPFALAKVSRSFLTISILSGYSNVLFKSIIFKTNAEPLVRPLIFCTKNTLPYAPWPINECTSKSLKVGICVGDTETENQKKKVQINNHNSTLNYQPSLLILVASNRLLSSSSLLLLSPNKWAFKLFLFLCFLRGGLDMGEVGKGGLGDSDCVGREICAPKKNPKNLFKWKMTLKKSLYYLDEPIYPVYCLLALYTLVCDIFSF